MLDKMIFEIGFISLSTFDALKGRVLGFEPAEGLKEVAKVRDEGGGEEDLKDDDDQGEGGDETILDGSEEDFLGSLGVGVWGVKVGEVLEDPQHTNKIDAHGVGGDAAAQGDQVVARHEGLEDQEGGDKVAVGAQPGVDGHLEHRLAHLMSAEDEGDAEEVHGPGQLRELLGNDLPPEPVAEVAKGLGREGEEVHQIRGGVAEVVGAAPISRALDVELSQRSSESNDARQDRGRELPPLMAQHVGDVKGGPFAGIARNIPVLVINGSADLDPQPPSPPSRKQDQQAPGLSVAASRIEDGLARLNLRHYSCFLFLLKKRKNKWREI